MNRSASAALLVAAVIGAVVGTPPASAAPEAGGRLVPPGPPRAAPVVALTGAEVVVFGGEDPARTRDGAKPRNDGAAYHPGTGRWRTIAPAPFKPALLRPSGAAVDGTLVVTGVPCERVRPDSTVESCLPGGAAFGAYRPDTDSWRTLSSPPGSPAGTRATILGARGGAAVVQVGSDRLWLLDPATDRWSPLPEPPLAERFCLDGRRIVAIAAERAAPTAARTGIAPAATAPRELFTATLSDTGDWTPVRAVPTPVADAACGPPADTVRLAGDRLIRVGADPRTAAVTLTLSDAANAAGPQGPPDPAWLKSVRRADRHQQPLAAAGPTAWFHEFNMAGSAMHSGGRAPADAVVYIVRAHQDKPFAIALNEVCIGWSNPASQVRIIADALGKNGYTVVTNTTQTRPGDTLCPEFGNAIVHIGNHHAYPRTFQYWYADAKQAPDDLNKQPPERRGGVCARVNAFWVFFACSSHLTPSNQTTGLNIRYRLLQSVTFHDLAGPWSGPPPEPDIDPAIPAIRAGDLNSEPDSPEMSGWLDGPPWVEGDDALNRGTTDGNRKIDYILASFTTGFSSAVVSPVGQSDHHYYKAVFAFTR